MTDFAILIFSFKDCKQSIVSAHVPQDMKRLAKAIYESNSESFFRMTSEETLEYL
jgi:hypothetical protein